MSRELNKFSRLIGEVANFSLYHGVGWVTEVNAISIAEEFERYAIASVFSPQVAD